PSTVVHGGRLNARHTDTTAALLSPERTAQVRLERGELISALVDLGRTTWHRCRGRTPMERVVNLLRVVASLLLALAVFFGRLLLVLLAIVPTWIGRVIEHLRSAPPAPVAPGGCRPRILFVGGTINHTTQVQQIAAALPECEPAFTWYYCDGVLEVLRRLGW